MTLKDLKSLRLLDFISRGSDSPGPPRWTSKTLNSLASKLLLLLRVDVSISLGFQDPKMSYLYFQLRVFQKVNLTVFNNVNTMFWKVHYDI